MTAKDIFEMQARLCQAMGNPARLQIVHILRDGPRQVSELANSMDISQPTISRHLAVLRRNGVVTAYRQRQEVFYQLSNPKIVAVCDLMRQVLADQLTHQAEIAKFTHK